MFCCLNQTEPEPHATNHVIAHDQESGLYDTYSGFLGSDSQDPSMEINIKCHDQWTADECILGSWRLWNFSTNYLGMMYKMTSFTKHCCSYKICQRGLCALSMSMKAAGIIQKHLSEYQNYSGGRSESKTQRVLPLWWIFLRHPTMSPRGEM